MTREIEIVRRPDGIEALAGEWSALAEERGNAFVTPEWFLAWLACAPHAGNPCVVVVRRDDGSLAGLLPFVSSAGRGRTLRFAGDRFGDRFHPVARVEDEFRVASATRRLFEGPGRISRVIVLRNADRGTGWPAGLIGGRPGLVETIDDTQPLPYIDLAGKTWEQLLASYSRNLRGQLGRRLRSLQRDHEVVFRTTTGPRTLAEDMGAFFALHLRRREKQGSSLDSPLARRFHDDFAARALARGWLRLHHLEVDGQGVAIWYGWRLGDKVSYYSSGWDPEWAERSVGLVILAHSIRLATEEGAAEYDLLVGGEAYKRRFETGCREVSSSVATSAFGPERVTYAVKVGLRRVGRRMPDGVRHRLHAAASYPGLSRLRRL